MMLFKVLVISVLCALAVAFPTEATTDDPLDLLSEELLNLPANIEDLLDSITNIIKTVRKLPPPIEKVIKIQKADTDSDPTMDFNPTSDFLSPTEGYHKNTQIAEVATEAPTAAPADPAEQSQSEVPEASADENSDPENEPEPEGEQVSSADEANEVTETQQEPEAEEPQDQPSSPPENPQEPPQEEDSPQDSSPPVNDHKPHNWSRFGPYGPFGPFKKFHPPSFDFGRLRQFFNRRWVAAN
ncbi:hypothetical protein ACRRTK_006082 [Alexandromys fortis]